MLAQRAHGTNIIFRRRCSSKRAVGDESASIAGGTTSELGRSTFMRCSSKRAPGGHSALPRWRRGNVGLFISMPHLRWMGRLRRLAMGPWDCYCGRRRRWRDALFEVPFGRSPGRSELRSQALRGPGGLPFAEQATIHLCPLILGNLGFVIPHRRRNLRLRVAFVIQQQIPH